MPDNLFAKAKIKFSLNGSVRETESVISKDRVNRVLKINKFSKSADLCNDFENPRFATLNFMDKPVKVQIIEEHTANGKFYNFDFKDLTTSQKQSIEQHIQHLGFPPTWKRKYFRIDSDPNQYSSEIPISAFESENFTAIDLSVVDFTLNGLLVKTRINEEGFKPFSLGSRIKLSLFTTENNVLEGFGGVVVRTIERFNKEKDCREQYAGIKLLNISPSSLKEYKRIIKDCCLEIKKNQLSKVA
jgi:hypothetical protein